MRASTGRRTARRTGAAGLAAVVVLALGSCTDDKESPPSPGPDADDVRLELSLGPGAEGLSTQARDELQNDVADVLSAYVVKAFLGDYPRDDFVEALDTFTSGLAQQGAEQIEQITGAGFGGADEVEATRLVASIAAFAPGRTALGASCHVDFAFAVTEDGEQREVTVQGRLVLLQTDQGWKIFTFRLRTDDPLTGSLS